MGPTGTALSGPASGTPPRAPSESIGPDKGSSRLPGCTDTGGVALGAGGLAEELGEALGQLRRLGPVHHVAGGGQLEAQRVRQAGHAVGLVGRVPAGGAAAHDQRRAVDRAAGTP